MSLSLSAIREQMSDINLPVDLMDEIHHDLHTDKLDINKFKAHQVRSVQQETAKQDTLRNLTENCVLIFMDWVMKFLIVKPSQIGLARGEYHGTSVWLWGKSRGT